MNPLRQKMSAGQIVAGMTAAELLRLRQHKVQAGGPGALHQWAE
jgi:hypothetical protein